MKRLSIFCGFASVLLLGCAVGWFLGRGALSGGGRGAPPPNGKEQRRDAVAALSTPASSPVAKRDGPNARIRVKKAAPSTTETGGPVRTEDLLFALGEKTVSVEFRCNGRDQLQMTGTNLNAQPLRLVIPAGQVFESANGNVVALRDKLVEFQSGEVRKEDVSTLGIASSNCVMDAPCTVSSARQPKLQPLLDYLADHPEVSTAAAQTAALAILENLPASAFAKFAVAGSDVPAQWDTAAFKVDVSDLIQALIVLKGIGIPDEQLAITVDPQTKIEAMLDPLSHAMAMRYYGIQPEAEWGYWKHELLEGDPSTRHYALHGIARYYPAVALPMLPQWARESRTNLVFRKVAIQALAETRQAAALPILKGLENELGPDTELGKTAAEAGDYLDAQLKQGSDSKKTVVFRVGSTP